LSPAAQGDKARVAASGFPPVERQRSGGVRPEAGRGRERSEPGFSAWGGFPRPPLRGGLIRGALSPNRRLGEGTPLLGQWGRGQCRTRGSGWSRGRSCWWERLPPTSRLTSFGGRNLPPFACGSGGQSQGGGMHRRRYLPPLRGGLIQGGETGQDFLLVAFQHVSQLPRWSSSVHSSWPQGRSATGSTMVAPASWTRS